METVTAARVGRHNLSRTVVTVAVRIAVSALLLAFLLSRSNIHVLTSALARGRPLLILAAFGLMMGVLLAGTLRWHVFLESLGVELPLLATLRLYLVGTFFNAFLPTGVGGDAYKAVGLGKRSDSMAEPFASVLLERI